VQEYVNVLKKVMKPSKTENEGVSLQHTRPPPQFSQFLEKKVYEKIKAICNENEIDVETFITELLATALNHHGKEIEQIIKKVKK
jgi:hypothetical protein